MGMTTSKEQAVRELVAKVYGAGATVAVSRDATGGMIRVLNAKGLRLAGWAWDASSTSQKTEEQAWHALLGIIRDDM